MSISRRTVLISGAGLLLPVASQASTQSVSNSTNNEVHDFWSLPRVLHLYRPATGETLQASYWDNGQLNVEGYVRICHLLRDHRENSAVQMDIKLLDLVRAIQGYMQYYSFNRPLIITSGYRSARSNSRLEGAARNSQHMLGKAIDFVMEGVPSNYLGLLASHYKGGGVGFYPSSGFTHIDTGNVRYWGQKGLNTLKIR